MHFYRHANATVHIPPKEYIDLDQLLYVLSLITERETVSRCLRRLTRRRYEAPSTTYEMTRRRQPGIIQRLLLTLSVEYQQMPDEEYINLSTKSYQALQRKCRTLESESRSKTESVSAWIRRGLESGPTFRPGIESGLTRINGIRPPACSYNDLDADSNP